MHDMYVCWCVQKGPAFSLLLAKAAEELARKLADSEEKAEETERKAMAVAQELQGESCAAHTATTAISIIVAVDILIVIPKQKRLGSSPPNKILGRSEGWAARPDVWLPSRLPLWLNC